MTANGRGRVTEREAARRLGVSHTRLQRATLQELDWVRTGGDRNVKTVCGLLVVSRDPRGARCHSRLANLGRGRTVGRAGHRRASPPTLMGTRLRQHLAERNDVRVSDT